MPAAIGLPVHHRHRQVVMEVRAIAGEDADEIVKLAAEILECALQLAVVDGSPSRVEDARRRTPRRAPAE